MEKKKYRKDGFKLESKTAHRSELQLVRERLVSDTLVVEQLNLEDCDYL